VRDELAHWRQLAGLDATLPRDFPPDSAASQVGNVATLNVELDETTTTALLRDAPAAYRLRADELLLAALAATLAEWTGRAATVVSLENHGREDLGDALDLSRTVGWFTSLFPVRLDCPPGTDAGALLTATKETIRRLPRHGIGFGLLAYLCADPAIRREATSWPRPEVCFNYLGQVDHTLGSDSPFGWVDAATGPGSSPRGHRAHLLDLNAIVVGGRLRISWIYSTRAHRPATIARHAEALLGHIRALLAHCTSPGAGGPTPSDFAHVRLDANELDALLDDLADPSPN
jgi:non-ribosomal peptide synthase protein (TIGR01720 family)